MRLVDVTFGLDCEIVGDKDIEITQLSHFDKECTVGSVFFCIHGEKVDGAQYAFSAIQHGASAIVTEKRLALDVVQVVVPNTRKAMALMAKNFYGRVCEKLKIVGITGTNGKTSTTYLIASILKANGNIYGVIGTNGAYIMDQSIYYGMTTPDPIVLHELLYTMYQAGVEYVLMEVSAHAIALDKMAGVKLDIGVLTNITYEHLDFFHSMQQYAKTKVDYFCQEYMKEAVVNVDNEYGVKIATMSHIPCLTYGQYTPANTFGVDITMSTKGMEMVVNALDDILYITSGLIGVYNVYNILASITVAKLLGIAAPVIAKGVADLKEIPGRWQVVEKEGKVVVVDFAHTPDGVEQVLQLARQLYQGKLVVVIGATYYADKEKCCMIGNILEKYTDYIILTADNPDRTKISVINDRILAGIQSKPYQCVDDRCQAIRHGIAQLGTGDVLLCLGKGAEQYQRMNGQLIKHNELAIVKQILGTKEDNDD